MNTIAIFDIGKTNKKLFLYDEYYKVVFEKSIQLPEIKDEDGFPCEDVVALSEWVKVSLTELFKNKDFEIKVINFSAHGASFVNVDTKGKPVTPLYNYLKPYPEHLKAKFYNSYGGQEFAVRTASPILGHLNSGMQLYWLKMERPGVFKKIKYVLHLPEYISYLITGKFYSGITSIGCHTNLWDFEKKTYHDWVSREEILERLAPIFPTDQIVQGNFNGRTISSGIGIHDSTAALIPYLKQFSESFALLSTGTWSISLNPFNHKALTLEELVNDCLCYLQPNGNPVKATRFFIGPEHDNIVKSISEKFHKSPGYFSCVKFDRSIFKKVKNFSTTTETPSTFEDQYHIEMIRLLDLQKKSTRKVMDNFTSQLLVDGGFSQNDVYMHLLAEAFPESKVYAASVAQASAFGAALIIHDHWNRNPVPTNLIALKRYRQGLSF